MKINISTRENNSMITSFHLRESRLNIYRKRWKEHKNTAIISLKDNGEKYNSLR